MKDKLCIGVVNFQAAWGNIPENLERIRKFCGQAKDLGAQMVVFPETALTGYSILEQGAMHRAAAQEIPGEASRAILRMAKDIDVYKRQPLLCNCAKRLTICTVKEFCIRI